MQYRLSGSMSIPPWWLTNVPLVWCQSWHSRDQGLAHLPVSGQATSLSSQERGQNSVHHTRSSRRGGHQNVLRLLDTISSPASRLGHHIFQEEGEGAGPLTLCRQRGRPPACQASPDLCHYLRMEPPFSQKCTPDGKRSIAMFRGPGK